MASPQTENGFTRIANELLSAMARANLSGAEFMVLLSVISKTYGWHKTKDEISISQFVEMTGLPKRTVCRATASLVSKMTLGKDQKSTNCTTYWVVKDYKKWGSVQNDTSAKIDTCVQNDTSTSDKNCNLLVSKMTHTKETIQKKHNKEALRPSGNFDSLWSVYPKRDGKKAAQRSFNASVKTEQDWQDIKKALGNYLLSDAVQKGYIKNGSTWFNNWQDWVEVNTTNTTGTSAPWDGR